MRKSLLAIKIASGLAFKTSRIKLRGRLEKLKPDHL